MVKFYVYRLFCYYLYNRQGTGFTFLADLNISFLLIAVLRTTSPSTIYHFILFFRRRHAITCFCWLRPELTSKLEEMSSKIRIEKIQFINLPKKVVPNNWSFLYLTVFQLSSWISTFELNVQQTWAGQANLLKHLIFFFQIQIWKIAKLKIFRYFIYRQHLKKHL